MKNRNRKLGQTAGFTLVEMLIVVAIIAILVAVSIPLVSSSLEKSRDATDMANERAAKAEATMVYLGAGKAMEVLVDLTADIHDFRECNINTGCFAYNAEDGKLYYTRYYDLPPDNYVYDNPNEILGKITPYGKCTGGDNCSQDYKDSEHWGDHRTSFIYVQIANDGAVTLKWCKPR